MRPRATSLTLRPSRPMPRPFGERFGDPDLFALATHSQGVFLVKQGRAPEGLALMDEAMLRVTAGELSPIASGLVYCWVILGCEEAYGAALRPGMDRCPDDLVLTSSRTWWPSPGVA